MGSKVAINVEDKDITYYRNLLFCLWFLEHFFFFPGGTESEIIPCSSTESLYGKIGPFTVSHLFPFYPSILFVVVVDVVVEMSHFNHFISKINYSLMSLLQLFNHNLYLPPPQVCLLQYPPWWIS